MSKHVKPTPEELEANRLKALEDLENIEEDKPEDHEEPKDEDQPEDDEPNTEEDDDESEGDEDDYDGEDNDDEEDADEPVKPEPKKVEKKKEDTNYKKKFVESSREAQVLHAKNKKVNEAIQKATEVSEPTDQEMEAIYSDWEDLSEFEKRMAKKAEHNERFKNTLLEATNQFKDMDAWQEKVDTFVDDPANLVKYPELDGREEEFKMFVTKPTRMNVDFEDLIPAFLFNAERTKKAKPKKKGSMFPSGSGGEKKAKPNDGKISQSEAAQLRKTDYAKYKQYVTSGKIRSTF